jgi:hypothetical protein
MFRWGVVAVVLVALLLSGCGQVAQKAVEQTTGVKTDQKGESVTITSKEGTAVSITANKTVPDELKDFPVPSGYTLDSSGTMSSGDDKLIVASWKGKSDYKAVADFYKKAMADKGWKNDFTMDADTGGMQNWSKGDYGVTITYDKPKDKDESSISILMGKGKKTPTPAKAEATDTPESEAAAPTPAKAEATDTPAPPKAGDASSIAPELKDVPVPSGFTLVEGSAIRMEEGGKFKGATANWFGKTSIKDVAQFYKGQMTGKGWKEALVMEQDDSSMLSYTSAKDENLTLTIGVTKTDAGTEVTWIMGQN